MKYYIANNGQQSGPFELNELLINGLNPQSLVWCETMPNWANAMQVPEVAALFQPQTPPQQPQTPPQQPYQQPYGGQQQYGYQQQQPQYGSQPQYGYPQSPKSMDFGEAINVCFSKFANFDGRARRSEYWWFMLFSTIISSVTCGIGSLVLLIPSLAVTARRLHDTGHSGWWQLLHLVPFGFIVILIWAVQDTDPGMNEYGPNPKQ